MPNFLQIEMTDGGVGAALARAEALAANPVTYLDPIGGGLVQSTKLRMRESRSPEGAAWAPVLRGGQPLIDTGVHLMNAVSHQVQGNSVVVGVPYAWAAVHQFGKTITAKRAPYLTFRVGKRWARKKQVRVPARPFLGISSEDRAMITGILGRVLTGEKS